MSKEEINYILESLRFKTSIYRDKHKRNLTFNDDEYYSNILNEYIEDLQKENQQLKEEISGWKNNYAILQNKVIECNEDRIRLNNVLDEIRELLNKTFEYGDEWHWDSGTIRNYLEDIEKLLDKVKE